MNGADPYSALHQQQQGLAQSQMSVEGSFAAPVPPQAQAHSRGGGSGVGERGSETCNAGFPILDKHKNPLVGSDTAKAVRFSC